MTAVVLTFETKEQAIAAVLALSEGYQVEQWSLCVNSTAKPYFVRFYVPSSDVTEISED